jgi:hypothetical protein
MKRNLRNIMSAFAFAIFIFMALGSEDEETSNLTPQEEKVQSQFSSWDGSHRGLEKIIKKSMNDPDSYEHDETRFRDDGDKIFVITKFRGKNAFGGTVSNTVSAYVDYNGNVINIVSQE